MTREEEITVLVRVPLSRIEDEVRRKHSISIPTVEASLEDGFIVFRFGIGRSEASTPDDADRNAPIAPRSSAVSQQGSDPSSSHPVPLRMRRKSKRNRMKTRGWGIVAKIVNSKGQTVAIYEPFVEALRGKNLTQREKAALVAGILRENGNRPGHVSIDYYLSNTLEYLARGGKS